MKSLELINNKKNLVKTIQKVCVYACIVLLIVNCVEAFSQTSNKSYVYNQKPLINISSPTEVDNLDLYTVRRTIKYFDGLGRIQQINQRQNTANTRKDFVQSFKYDQYGRQLYDYLPFASLTSDGSYKEDWLGSSQQPGEIRQFYSDHSFPIAHTDYPWAPRQFDSSPLDRVLYQGAPGYDWQLTQHPTEYNYRSNEYNEFVLYFEPSGQYEWFGFPRAENKLEVTEVTDENGVINRVFKDKEDRVVLNETEMSDGTKLRSYFVYDSYNNLVLVIPPKASKNLTQYCPVTNLDELCYQYEYDEKQRMTKKRLPGQDEIYYVYDELDRVILTQDGNLRNQGKWQYIKYDIHSRPIITGIHSDGASNLTQKQTSANVYVDNYSTFYFEEPSGGITYYTDQTYPPLQAQDYALTETYYDNYDYISVENSHLQFQEPLIQGENDPDFEIEPFYRNIGKTTGKKVRTLEQDHNQRQWLFSSIYYDEFGRIIETINDNRIDGYDIEYLAYDFEGKVTAKRIDHIINAGGPEEEIIILKWRYYYDQGGRLTHIFNKIGNQEEELIVFNKYNEIGQLIEKNLHAIFAGEEAGGFLQSLDYRYNTRGWLSRINRSNLANSNIFIDDDLNIQSDEMVTQMIIDDLNLVFIEEEIGEGENIMHLTFTDNKRLVLQKIDDPNQTRIIDADEIEYIQIKEANDVEYYSTIKDLDGEQFTFDLSSVLIDQYEELSTIRDTISTLVNIELDKNHVENETTRQQVCSKVDAYFNGNLGIVYFNEDNSDLFGLDLLYNQGFLSLGGAEQYNGNISGMKWQVKGNETQIRGYGFQYDYANRLKKANYAEMENFNWNSAVDHYTVGGPDNGRIDYDENGNIEGLSRVGCNSRKEPYQFGLIDNLTYSYDGNRLNNVNDAIVDLGFTSNDFRDNTTSGSSDQEYYYDNNGNLIRDDNKNIENISYNFLNLPVEINFGGGNKIEYLYDANGNKQNKKVYQNSSLILDMTYSSSFVYNDQGLEYILFDEGRLTPQTDGTFQYEYFLKDHLGNTRVVFKEEGEGVAILQESHYYPFGMSFMGTPSVSMDVENFYKYNGKELQADGFDLENDGIIESRLLLHDYGARFYDQQLGRFHVQDRYSEKYYSLSTYQYGANNPVLLIDVNGDSLWINYRGSNILYENGKLFNQDGTKYSGEGVKKNGKLKGFLRKAVNALNTINSKNTGSDLISELQSSDNNFYIKHASMNPNGYGNEFISRKHTKAFALQLQTDPAQARSYSALQRMGKDLSGGSGGSIYWDPSAGALPTTQGVYTSTTANLAHELFHGRQANNGALDSRTYMNPKIERYEWNAVYWENVLRGELGIPLRTHYISTHDPSGNVIGGSGPRMITPSNTPILPIYPINPRKIGLIN